MQLAFISYRRDDEGRASRFLKLELERYFGSEQVFMDMDNIRTADNWQEIIASNLKKSTVLLVIIGKEWLKIHDENFRRRIDNEDDWVRKEIETAIESGIKIIPVLMGGAIPDEKALPASIKKLASFQAISVTAMGWINDVANLVSTLIRLGFERKDSLIRYPAPIKDMLFPLPLTEQQLAAELEKLPGWKPIKYMSRDKDPVEGIAIEKHYLFGSFKDAIEFMYKASRHIAKIKHHPEWENAWRTVRVRLSTWDIGHKVSNLDINLARYLEETKTQLEKDKQKQTMG